MPHLSDDRFLVAHGLRVKGFASTEVVAAVVGLDASAVTPHLEALRDAGHAQLREGRLTGWSLTPDGREYHATACAGDLDRSGHRAAIDAAYRSFLELNAGFLALCTDWQVVDGSAGRTPQVLNEHADAAYDARVIARLIEVDGQVQPILVGLSGGMGRFAGYGPRLAEARKRVESGEQDWFTGAMIESYHTVWFELHEDLLVTLGIERSKEAS